MTPTPSYLVRSNLAPIWMKFSVSAVDTDGFGKDIAHFDSKEDANLFIKSKELVDSLNTIGVKEHNDEL